MCLHMWEGTEATSRGWRLILDTTLSTRQYFLISLTNKNTDFSINREICMLSLPLNNNLFAVNIEVLDRLFACDLEIAYNGML